MNLQLRLVEEKISTLQFELVRAQIILDSPNMSEYHDKTAQGIIEIQEKLDTYKKAYPEYFI